MLWNWITDLNPKEYLSNPISDIMTNFDDIKQQLVPSKSRPKNLRELRPIIMETASFFFKLSQTGHKSSLCRNSDKKNKTDPLCSKPPNPIIIVHCEASISRQTAPEITMITECSFSLGFTLQGHYFLQENIKNCFPTPFSFLPKHAFPVIPKYMLVSWRIYREWSPMNKQSLNVARKDSNNKNCPSESVHTSHASRYSQTACSVCFHPVLFGFVL